MLSYVLIGLFGLLTMALDPANAAATSDDSSETGSAPAYAEARDLATAIGAAGEVRPKSTRFAPLCPVKNSAG